MNKQQTLEHLKAIYQLEYDQLETIHAHAHDAGDDAEMESAEKLMWQTKRSLSYVNRLMVQPEPFPVKE